MCFLDKETGEMSATGCVMSIRQFDAGDDGRALVLCKGECRMAVVDVLSEGPVLECRCRIFDEGPMDPLESQEVAHADATEAEARLADEVRALYRATVALGTDEEAVWQAAAYGSSTDGEVPMVLGGPALDRLTPAALAYFVASRFDALDERMLVLELRTPEERLERVRVVLSGVSGYLRAEKAVNEALD